jgi:hypothetical protein
MTTWRTQTFPEVDHEIPVLGGVVYAMPAAVPFGPNSLDLAGQAIDGQRSGSPRSRLGWLRPPSTSMTLPVM